MKVLWSWCWCWRRWCWQDGVGISTRRTARGNIRIKGGGLNPPAPPPDPPIIVHGGSFHVQVYDGASDPGDGSKGVTIPVGTTDVIDLGNYTPVAGTYSSFSSPWEVDICDDSGLNKDGSKCKGAGVAIVNAGTTGITVTQLDSNDKFGRLGRKSSPAWNYAYKLRPVPWGSLIGRATFSSRRGEIHTNTRAGRIATVMVTGRPAGWRWDSFRWNDVAGAKSREGEIQGHCYTIFWSM